MSRKIADFAPSPEAAAAAAAILEREREARRTNVDPARVDRLAAQLRVGDEAVPAVARVLAADAEALVRAGADPEVVERLAANAGRCGPDERAASVREGVAVGRGAPPPLKPPARRWPLPDLDVRRLLRRCPAALAHVEATARLALSSNELPCLVFLGATSCALAAKVVAQTRNNDGGAYPFWPHLFIAAEADSTANKSMILNRMLRHYLIGKKDEHHPSRKVGGVWEKMRKEQTAVAAADANRREQWTNERASLRRKTGDAVTPDVVKRLAELDDLLGEAPIHPPDVAEVGAPTPERHVILSHRTGFRAFVPDEGAGVINRFLGAKPLEAKVEPLIAGFDGDPWTYPSIAGDMRGDGTPRFEDHHLVMVLPLQPGVLSPKAEEEARRLHNAADRGVFPRLLCARTRPLEQAEIDALEGQAEALAETSKEGAKRYERVLRALADLRVSEDDHPLHPRKPIVLEFTDEATRARRAYQVKLKKDVALDGPDRSKPGERSIARLSDHAARIAACLAAWRTAEAADRAGGAVTAGDLEAARVELDDVQAAIEACEAYFRPHALAVAGRAILDREDDDATALREVLERLREKGQLVVKQREAQRALGRGWTAKRTAAAIAALVEREEIRADHSKRGSVTITWA